MVKGLWMSAVYNVPTPPGTSFLLTSATVRLLYDLGSNQILTGDCPGAVRTCKHSKSNGEQWSLKVTLIHHIWI